ncbi:MAG: hypothetical protein IKU79_08345 [Bacteroidaceae bacterium]|nr:hypothetical protein [Bacteroidaceae bacterium]
MSIKSNIPQIATLRREVEGRFGLRLQTHTHFVSLAETIEKDLREHLSPTTLERVWGYSTRHYDTVSLRTLDVLAKYAGREGWEKFCVELKQSETTESDFFSEGIMEVASLNEGIRLRLGWQPDRMCEVRYLGNNRFVVESVTNGSLRVGDTFSCLQLQVGKLLYMDCFLREGETPEAVQRYAVGRENGLTLLEIIERQED